MANLLQSSATTATQAPTYYNDYLSNLATSGTQAAKNAQFVGAQPLQEQAFEQVADKASAFQPTLTAAEQTLGRAASTPSPLSAASPYFQAAGTSPAELARQYMDPYTQTVVNNLGDVGARNIRMNLAPSATAGAVGSGQFGSKRGAEVLGQTISNADRDILNAQYTALNDAYKSALTAAGTQNQLQANLGKAAGDLTTAEKQALTQAGTAQGQLAGTNQALNLADINALATLGGQQQTIAQNKQNFPLTTLSTLSGLMAGQNIPTSTVQTAETSPLAAMASVGSGLGALFQTPATGGKSLFENMTGQSSLGGLFSAAGTGISNAYDSLSNAYKNNYMVDPTEAAGVNANGTQVYYDTNTGNYYDSNGKGVAISGGEGE